MEFRKKVAECVTIHSIKSFDAWFDMVRGLQPLYDGIMLRSSSVNMVTGGRNAFVQRGLSTTYNKSPTPYTTARAFAAKETNVFSDDPPARVTPVKVEMAPSVYSVKFPTPRRYHKEGSLAMAALMSRLERFRYVYRNSLATIASPAYPVRKEKVDPKAPLEER